MQYIRTFAHANLCLGLMLLSITACEDAASDTGEGTGYSDFSSGPVSVSPNPAGGAYSIVKDGDGNVLGWLIQEDQEVIHVITSTGHNFSLDTSTGKVVGDAAASDAVVSSASDVYLDFTGNYVEVSGVGYATDVFVGNYPGPIAAYSYNSESDEDAAGWTAASGTENGYLAKTITDRTTVGLIGAVGSAFTLPISATELTAADPSPVYYVIYDGDANLLGTSLMNSASTGDAAVTEYIANVVTTVGSFVRINNLGEVHASIYDMYANEPTVTSTSTVVAEATLTMYIEVAGYGYLFDEAARQQGTLPVTPATYPVEIDRTTYPYSWTTTIEDDTLTSYFQTSATATRADAGLPGTVGAAIALPLSVSGPYQ